MDAKDLKKLDEEIKAYRDAPLPYTKVGREALTKEEQDEEDHREKKEWEKFNKQMEAKKKEAK